MLVFESHVSIKLAKDVRYVLSFIVVVVCLSADRKHKPTPRCDVCMFLLYSKIARTTGVATQGSSELRDNITCVYGSKQLAVLQPISLDLDLYSSASTSAGGESKTIKPAAANGGSGGGGGGTTSSTTSTTRVVGYISKAQPKCGRASADRQHFYINRRPCDLPKLARIVNDTYRYVPVRVVE